MKYRLLVGAVSCVLLYLGYSAVGAFRPAEAVELLQGQSPADDGDLAVPEPIRVKVVKPNKGGIPRQCIQPADVQSFEFVKMYAQVSGVLKNQDVDIKSRVKKEQLLAELDAPELIQIKLQAKANVEKAAAQVDQATARLDTVQAEIKAAELLIEQRKSDLIATKAYLQFRGKQLTRYKTLFAKNALEGYIVDEEIDRYDAAFSRNETAVLAVGTAEADLIAKKAKLVESKADLVAAKADVRVMLALLEKAEVNVRFTKLIAPFDGVVTQRNFNNGDFIRDADREGQAPLLVVNRTDLMRVIVRVPDKDAPFIRVGDLSELRLPSFPGTVFKGNVARYAEAEDPATRTMRVEIDMENRDGLLRDGMFGEVTLHIGGTPEKALTIPSTCLQRQGTRDQRFVYVVQDGKAHQTPVTVGYDNLERVEVLSGLRADQSVVAEHSGPISNGVPVQVVPER